MLEVEHDGAQRHARLAAMSDGTTDRRTWSLERLAELQQRLDAPLAELIGGHPFCIYATGSYGRLEAWQQSDIDLFFLDGHRSGDAFSWIAFVQVAARLIQETEAMSFPPFSGDGKYLTIQTIQRMQQVLGSPEDDSANAFTARMLLLLESRPVTATALYDELLAQVIGFYYRDFEGNEESFLPIFLTNDILRFWRTLTLNYEHDRLKLRALSGADQERAKAKSALKNYKLKASRLATCFSMIVHLATDPAPVPLENVFALCKQTPTERFEALRGRTASADSLIDDLATRYGAFLDFVQRPEADVLADFANPENRREKLDEAAAYGSQIFALLTELVEPERLRHLVV
jgi:hypothetical protein